MSSSVVTQAAEVAGERLGAVAWPERLAAALGIPRSARQTNGPGPVAHGTPWVQRARYLSAPILRPVVTVRRVSGSTRQGAPFSILVVDDAAPLRLLLAAMSAGPTTSEAWGRVSMAGALALLRRESAGHDLVLARVPGIVADQAAGTDFLRLPWLVDMWVRASEVAKRRQRGRGTVASAYARWKQQGFTTARGDTAADLARFYQTMYLPFADARFGEAASTLSRATLQRALAKGTILWVEQDGRPVAGQLLERSGDTLHTVAVGTSLAPEAAQATGVLTALKVAASDLALAEGIEWLDFGGCMPWLTDGVLQNKRQWGAELVHRGGLHRALLASWSRWTPAAEALLALAPIGRHGTTTLAVTTATPRGNQPADKLAVPGIDRLLIVDEAAATAAAAPGDRVRVVAPGASAEILAAAGRADARTARG